MDIPLIIDAEKLWSIFWSSKE